MLPALRGTENLQQYLSLTHQHPRGPLPLFPAGREGIGPHREVSGPCPSRPAFQADAKAEGDITEMLANIIPSLVREALADLVNLRMPSAP